MRGALLLAAMLLSSLGASCGASFEAVYEGNVRFEHCYRLDRDVGIASSHREYCWAQWVQTYTYGQSQDRVEYAKRRIRVLRGEPPPGAQPSAVQALSLTDPSSGGTLRSQPGQPLPANTSDLPPEMAAKEQVPGESCAATCRGALEQCRKGCQTAPKGCVPCEPDYGSCMRRCFE